MRVRTIPLQPHCFFFGGFDIQMHRTLTVMQRYGIDAGPLDFWSRDAEFDAIHCWGLDGAHQVTVAAARRYGKKVCISHLAPPLTLRGWVRHAGAWVEGRRRVQMSILDMADRLFVHNELQVESAVYMLRMPRERVRIIPTILDPALYDRTPVEPFDDLREYVACVGNIWPRKNQLRVAQAALMVKCPVIFIGNLMGGQKAYTDEFLSLVEKTPFFRWYRWVSEEDLRRIYYNSLGVVLPSFDETQPGAPLEGGAMGKPIILGKRPYARQKYYKNAYQADPSSVESIAKGLLSILSTPEKYTPPEDYIWECHPDAVGARFQEIFDELAAEGK